MNIRYGIGKNGSQEINFNDAHIIMFAECVRDEHGNIIKERFPGSDCYISLKDTSNGLKFSYSFSSMATAGAFLSRVRHIPEMELKFNNHTFGDISTGGSPGDAEKRIQFCDEIMESMFDVRVHADERDSVSCI